MILKYSEGSTTWFKPSTSMLVPERLRARAQSAQGKLTLHLV